MTLTTICRRCKRARPCPCPTTVEHKTAKNRAKKYTSARWQRVRRQRLELDGHRCTVCGTRQDLTVDLTVGEDHSLARLDDCRTLCRACHGRKDGGNARRPPKWAPPLFEA